VFTKWREVFRFLGRRWLRTLPAHYPVLRILAIANKTSFNMYWPHLIFSEDLYPCIIALCCVWETNDEVARPYVHQICWASIQNRLTSHYLRAAVCLKNRRREDIYYVC